jgi:glutamine cyclotransferase
MKHRAKGLLISENTITKLENIKQVDLDSKYFGEGITFLNDKLYQLTWQEKTGFIYNATSLKLENLRLY